MKTRLFLFASILLTSFSLSAQQKANDSVSAPCCRQEIGIGINGSAEFNIGYDVSVQRTMFRISANSLAFATEHNAPLNFNTNAMISVLRVKSLSQKLDFIWGIIGGVEISNGTFENSFASTAPFAGVALGLKFNINKAFSLYAEVDPAFITSRVNTYLAPNTTNPSITDYTYSFGISSVSINGAYFTLAYKLGRK